MSTSCSSLSLNFDLLWEESPRSHIGNLTQEASITITPCPPDPELPEVQNLEPQSSKTLGDGLLWGRIPNGFVENPGTKWVLPSVVGHYHLMATRLSVKKESHVSKIDVLSFHTTVYGVLTEMRNLQNALLNGWIFDFVLIGIEWIFAGATYSGDTTTSTNMNTLPEINSNGPWK